MDRQPKNSPAGVTRDHAGDVQQPVAQLFDPQPPPGTVQVYILEDLNQVVGEKLELKEHRIGQEVFREDMISRIPSLSSRMTFSSSPLFR